MADNFMSVVIPAHNENSRKLGEAISTIEGYLAKNFPKHEIIIVDNASTDGTGEYVKKLLPANKNLSLITEDTLGKGAAVKKGILASKGDRILFCDADLSTPIDELGHLMHVMEKGSIDIAIGSRKIQGAVIRKRQSLPRVFASNALNLLIRILFGISIHDTQCGFKLFKRTAALDLFAAQKIDGFLFDLEILYLAKKKGISVAEVPVKWENCSAGSLNPFVELIRVPMELFRIKMLHG